MRRYRTTGNDGWRFTPPQRTAWTDLVNGPLKLEPMPEPRRGLIERILGR